jgi:N-glycosylase/DNA lyase
LERIDLKGQPLDLESTFGCGQAFRWRKREDGVWHGVVRDRLVELAVEGGVLHWRTYPDGARALVEDYLRLADDVKSVYRELSGRDPHLAALVRRFHGLRLLRQDPTEALISFVCSAANSIPRICRAIEELASRYGELVCEKETLCYHAFPTPERLASAKLEGHASLGFRGRIVMSVAGHIIERGEGWLIGLRDMSYSDAREQLLSIRGVGRKIADCVCLFALDKDEAVPVDTHIRQIAHRLFLPEMNAKSVTDGVYRQIVEAFGERYGELAGWAQQFLYYEDLLRSRTQPDENRSQRDQ